MVYLKFVYQVDFCNKINRLIMLRTATLICFIVVVAADSSQQKCANNATYLEKSDYCSCLSGYLGPTCNITAYQIKENNTQIILSNEYTFLYFTPQEKVIYRFILTFCSLTSDQKLNIEIFASEEQKKGDFQLQPKRKDGVEHLTLQPANSCQTLLSTVLVAVDKKMNDQEARIIIGIRLLTENSTQKQSILVKCQISAIFTLSFITIALIAFLVIVSCFLVLSFIFLIRKKLLERRSQREEEIKKMECINELMPCRNYQTLIEEQMSVQNDKCCSICLCQFQKSQAVRQTPCEHVFHSGCIESWCQNQLNCPICRATFEKGKLIQEQQQIEPDVTNIRQPIL